jgi:hypothetical protein
MKVWVGRRFNLVAFSLAEANERLWKKLRLGKRLGALAPAALGATLSSQELPRRRKRRK